MNLLANFNNTGFFKDLNKPLIPHLLELISTEEIYVNVLEKVVCGYMREFLDENTDIPPPEDLKEYNGCVIFSNIADIYDFHKNYFLDALKKSQYSVQGLSQIFTQNKHYFHMYAKFSLNKPISDHLISTNINYFDKIKKKLGHKLSITDLMIAPVQRVTRYPLLLESFLKYLTKNGVPEDIKYLNDACDMLKEVLKEVNEFTALNGIRNFDGLLSAQGNLFLHGPLTCNYRGRRTKFHVFLFKYSILFTEKQKLGRKCLSSTFNFRLRIPVNQLQLKELTHSKFSLQLVNSNGSNCSVICQTFSMKEQKMWTQAIRQLLTTQTDLIRDLVHPSLTHPNSSDEREILL